MVGWQGRRLLGRPGAANRPGSRGRETTRPAAPRRPGGPRGPGARGSGGPGTSGTYGPGRPGTRGTGGPGRPGARGTGGPGARGRPGGGICRSGRAARSPLSPDHHALAVQPRAVRSPATQPLTHAGPRRAVPHHAAPRRAAPAVPLGGIGGRTSRSGRCQASPARAGSGSRNRPPRWHRQPSRHSADTRRPMTGAKPLARSQRTLHGPCAASSPNRCPACEPASVSRTATPPPPPHGPSDDGVTPRPGGRLRPAEGVVGDWSTRFNAGELGAVSSGLRTRRTQVRPPRRRRGGPGPAPTA